MGKKLNFLLYGEGSFLNKGCEAIVNTTIKKIRKNYDGEIILSTNDLNDSKFYNDIITKYVKGYYKEDELSEDEKKMIEYYNTIPFDYENFEKMYEKDCLKEIKNADICIHVGGDNYCYGEPNWIYTINKEIKEQNRKNVFLCTSIFETIESDEMIRDLKNYDLIMARETLTYNALEKFVDKERLILTPDTAFSLKRKECELPDVFKQDKKVVGINISPLISNYTEKKGNIVESIKALIEYILKETDNNVCLIPHVYIEGNNDLDSLKMIKELYKDEDRIAVLDDRIYNCEELKYVISNCAYLIAARTHASIAGYSSIVPTLVIGYSVKSKGIALDLFDNYEDYVIPVDKMTPEILLDKFKYIVENEENIKNILNKKIPIYKEEADNQIVMMVEKLEELEKKYVTNRVNCTGCMACFNICPNDAIEMKESKDGFLFPQINEEKCIKCNLCRKVCPANEVYVNKNKEPECYAVYNKNDQERLNSSSGGTMCVIAKEVLANNGIVYGATLEEKQVKHIRVDNVEDIIKIMGSKYVQSIIGNTYKDVKNDIEAGKEVLFTGTPCQIEGLKSYLGKEYDNLICVSIICHGVPSPGVFKRYIEEKEKKENKEIVNINFRDKECGWHKYGVSYHYDDTKEMVPFTDDTYMEIFLRNYCLRDSCYNCEMKFEKKNRADIVIGDFWGIETVLPEMNDDKGISAVIINSEKGHEIFDKIKSKVEYQKTTFEDILRTNPVLTSSVKYTKLKNDFFDMLENNQIDVVNKAIYGIMADKQLEEMQNRFEKEITNKDAIIEDLNKYIEDLLEAKKYFLEQIEQKDGEMQKIYYSRRWKYTAKIANLLNKIRGKKV